ncbi:hypothetical protein P7C70_g6815, partial [Phenoliferia sp. Uapishka_3]
MIYLTRRCQSAQSKHQHSTRRRSASPRIPDPILTYSLLKRRSVESILPLTEATLSVNPIPRPTSNAKSLLDKSTSAEIVNTHVKVDSEHAKRGGKDNEAAGQSADVVLVVVVEEAAIEEERVEVAVPKLRAEVEEVEDWANVKEAFEARMVRHHLSRAIKERDVRWNAAGEEVSGWMEAEVEDGRASAGRLVLRRRPTFGGREWILLGLMRI